jgi:type I restriction enzyme R subunit
MTEPLSTASLHQEHVFEQHIVQCLVNHQDYVERECALHYDASMALDKGLLFQFLKSTQPDAWKTLEDHYRTEAENEVIKRLEKALKEHPTHKVLRDGIKLVPNIQFALCFFKPASNLNPELTRLYQANILSVMRQVFYSKKNRNAIDIVTFVNGVPVV